MPLAPLDLDVRSFATTQVGSFEQLQTLIHLVATSDRWWDAQSLACELGFSIAVSRAALDALATRNLLDLRVTADVRYRFRPGTVDLERCARTLAAAYRQDPGAVAGLVASQVPPGINDVVDACRVRKGPLDVE